MINIGIIGAGRIGKVHCKSIGNNVPEAKVIAIADPFLDEETKQLAKRYGVQCITTDYKEILNNKDVDAVLICSATNTHAAISIEAAKAGKHVFCEKPVDTNPENIKEVIEAIKKAGVKFQVGFNRRFDDNFKAIKDAVLEGKIGEPHIIHITSRDPAPPPISYVKVSGGMFMDMTIHDFDMIRYLSGSEAVEVFASAGVLIDKEIGEAGDVDTAVITIKMANNAIAVIDNSRKAAYGYDQRAEVFGSKGAIATSNNTKSTAVLSVEDGVISEKPLYFFLERYMQSFRDEMKSFVDAIVNNKDVSVNVNDGLQPVLIALAAQKSVKENRPVKISEI